MSGKSGRRSIRRGSSHHADFFFRSRLADRYWPHSEIDPDAAMRKVENVSFNSKKRPPTDERIYWNLDDRRFEPGHMYYNRDGTPQEDGLEWSRMFQNSDRRVALDKLPNGIEVSTVFLGVNHAFDRSAPPLIFESIAFGPDRSDVGMERYTTEEQARCGHKKMVHKMKRVKI